MTVHKRPKYIGHALRNDIEERDEVQVNIDGDYYNRGVVSVNNPESIEREVVLDGNIALYVDAEEQEDEYDLDWSVWADRGGDIPFDDGTINALNIVNKDNELPNATIEEVNDERNEDISLEDVEGGLDQMREMVEELQYIIGQGERVESNAITLKEYENRLDSLVVRKGGSMALDDW